MNRSFEKFVITYQLIVKKNWKNYNHYYLFTNFFTNSNWDLFLPALAKGLSLESEWQYVSSVNLDNAVV